MENIKTVQFTNLGPLSPPTSTTTTIGDAEIVITHKLPYEKVLEMIQWTINFVVDDRGYISAPTRRIITELAVIRYYTNLDFAAFEREGFNQGELYEYYDLIDHFGIYPTVAETIDATQLDFFLTTSAQTIDSLVTYRNSAAGVLELISGESKTAGDNIRESLEVLQDEDEFAKIFQLLELAQPSADIPKDAPKLEVIE